MTGLMYAIIEGKLKRHPNYLDTMTFVKREDELEELCPLWLGSGLRVLRDWDFIKKLMDDSTSGFRVCHNLWGEMKIISYTKKLPQPEEVQRAFDDFTDSRAQLLHMKFNSPLVNALMSASPDVEKTLLSDLEVLGDVWTKYVGFMKVSTEMSLACIKGTPMPSETDIKAAYSALEASLKTRFPGLMNVPDLEI